MSLDVKTTRLKRKILRIFLMGLQEVDIGLLSAAMSVKTAKYTSSDLQFQLLSHLSQTMKSHLPEHTAYRPHPCSFTLCTLCGLLTHFLK